MGWFSKRPAIPPRLLKSLVVSASAVALIALLCGPCESSTNQLCTTTIKAIASSLLLTETKPIAPRNNSVTDTTFRTTDHSIKNTFKNSSNDCVNTTSKKYDSSTVENTARKRRDLITMHAFSTVHFLTYNYGNLTKALPLTHHKHSRQSGRMVSLPSASLTSIQRLTPLDTSSKKSPGTRLPIITYDATNTESLIGSSLNTSPCRSNPE